MTDMIEIITAVVPILGSLGGAATFVWIKIEKRFTEIESQLEACQRRERGDLERRAVQLTTIELLWFELKRLAPETPVLERARQLLDKLKIGIDEDGARG